MFILLLNNHTWCRCHTREEAITRKRYLESQGFSVLIMEGSIYK
jgi:hypothetical protein